MAPARLVNTISIIKLLDNLSLHNLRAAFSFYIQIIFVLLFLRPSTARHVCIQASPALRGPGHSAGGQQADSRCPVKKSSACANQKITLVLRSRISYDSQGVADYILARPENINYDIINSLSAACLYCICLDFVSNPLRPLKRP